MKAESSAPAGTRMMGIVHSALRRDLDRATDVLGGQSVPGDDQRQAVAQHIEAMMDFLQVHHNGEDAWLWPTVRRLNPAASEVLDQMMPIVASTLTPGQWDAWEQEYYVKTKSKKDLGMEGHWLIDAGDRAAYDHVVGKVNPVLRFVLLRVFGPRYRKACVARWGTDVAVGPTRGEASGAEQPEIIGSARRPWRTRGLVSLHIDAPAERLYDLIADVATTPSRSREVQGCRWMNGPPPGTAGSRFRGRNRAGVIRWSRVCEVVTAKRGEEFAFRTVPESFDPARRDSCIWGYRFEPDGTETRITHYYRFIEPPRPWLLTLYGILMPQHRDARPALRHTLEQFKAATEAR